MRIPINIISPLILFWSMIYVLALLSIYTAGLVARCSGAQRIRNQLYCPPTSNPMGQQ
ncbi:MAG TPA: hypothetical protein VMB80_15610 [Candidatus Acidoferrum sp.]|nr:hypothetical protein [Candidatus Acidoferrum sp.]